MSVTESVSKKTSLVVSKFSKTLPDSLKMEKSCLEFNIKVKL